MGVAPVKVYLDSCIVIYLVEEHPRFSSIVCNAFAISEGRQFCISPLVELECLVGPLRVENTPLIQRYKIFFQHQIILDIESISLSLCRRTASAARLENTRRTTFGNRPSLRL